MPQIKHNHETITLYTKKEPLQLECGKTLGPVDVVYETFGTLNTRKSNAILICHALTGDAHVTGSSASDKKPGWWSTLVGPKKAIDTRKYFVICPNVLGSCYGTTGPSSINPQTKKPYGLNFPVITIGDMVSVQHKLIETLGIKTLHMVVGGSMGGMQALEWAIRFPSKMRAVAAIATAVQLTTQSLAFNAVGREAILSDPNWEKGKYDQKSKPRHGLGIARMLGHITYRSNESLGDRFGRQLQAGTDYGYKFSTEFKLESYLKHQGDKFVDRFDPNSYLYLAKAMSYFDLIKRYKTLEKAFNPIQARMLVVSISSDWLYPNVESKRIVKALMKLGKDVTYCEAESPHGHDGFLMETPTLHGMVKGFLGATKIGGAS